nr:fungal specific transcription factor [Colletotrichum truncatum]KAF6800814.1 fungal specific transcription factor [Colletotrichum truncatum]
MPPDEDESLNRILDTLGLSNVQVTPEQIIQLPIGLDSSQETQPPAPFIPIATPMAPPGQLPSNLALPFDTTVFRLENDGTSYVHPAWSQHREVAASNMSDWEWSSPGNDDTIAPSVNVASVRAPSHPLLGSHSVEAPLSDNDDSTSGTTEEDLLNQLSDRLGSLHIGPNGKISYFGPTSNFSLVEMPLGSDVLAVDRTVRNDGQEHLDNMGYGKTIPPDLEEHLISLYFTWQDPFSHIVDRALYEDAKQKWFEREEDTPYYSEALRNAMCSLGAAFEARYHPSFITFPKSLPEFFAARAKTLLEIELDSPSISTIQAMAVLSSHEVGANRDSRGWLYSGMAIRLAFDLALHKDMTPYVVKGVLTPAEAELRRAVFWGTYAIDQSLGYYRGRPFRVSLDDITVEKPRVNTSEVKRWFPYTSPNSDGGPSATLVDFVEDVSLQRIGLCEIMAPLGYTL